MNNITETQSKIVELVCLLSSEDLDIDKVIEKSNELDIELVGDNGKFMSLYKVLGLLNKKWNKGE